MVPGFLKYFDFTVDECARQGRERGCYIKYPFCHCLSVLGLRGILRDYCSSEVENMMEIIVHGYC